MSSGVRRLEQGSAPDRKPVSLPRIEEMKAKGEPIVMVTAYDHPSARVAEEAGVSIVRNVPLARALHSACKIGDVIPALVTSAPGIPSNSIRSRSRAVRPSKMASACWSARPPGPARRSSANSRSIWPGWRARSAKSFKKIKKTI